MKFLFLFLFVANSSFAQVSDRMKSILSCTMGYGDADTYYQLELQKHATDDALYISINTIADGISTPSDLISVVSDTGPTGVPTYKNLKNNFFMYLIKKENSLIAKINDGRKNSKKPKYFEFDECTWEK